MVLGTVPTGSFTAAGCGAAGDPPRRGWPALAPRMVTSPESTLLLVADPDPILLQELAGALLDRGMGHVIRVDAVDGVDEVLTGGVVGDLALIGLGFGDPALRLIAELRAAGWSRVLALAPTIDPGPLLDAVLAGATGVLRCPPGTRDYYPDSGPLPELSAREVEILRLVADGRSNKWIGDRLSLPSVTVKKTLAGIARKFGRGAREELVAIALRAGIID